MIESNPVLSKMHPALRLEADFAALHSTLKADVEGDAIRKRIRARLGQHRGQRWRLPRKTLGNGSAINDQPSPLQESRELPGLLQELSEAQRIYVERQTVAREESLRKKLQKRDHRGRPVVPEEFSRELAKFAKPNPNNVRFQADKTEELTTVRTQTYMNSFDKHQDILQNILPPLSSDFKAYMVSVGFERNGMTLEPISDSCACLGCQHLQNGGWGKQLALTTPYRTRKGPVVRNLALRGAEMIAEVYTKDNSKKFCARSFSVSMATKRLVEFAAEKEGGYESVNALNLRCICTGIVRLEMGRRLVQNRCLPMVEPRHEEATREIFRAIEAKNFSGRINKVFVQYLIDTFSEAKEDDRIDLLTWDELLHGQRHLGSPGSKAHVLAVRAFFEGRCPSYVHKTSFESEDFYLLIGLTAKKAEEAE